MNRTGFTTSRGHQAAGGCHPAAVHALPPSSNFAHDVPKQPRTIQGQLLTDRRLDGPPAGFGLPAGVRESEPEGGMTKTCFRGACAKASAGAWAAERGPPAKRTNATKSCPAHRSWSRTCAPPVPPGGRGWRKRRSLNTSAHPLDNASFSERICFPEPVAFSALDFGSAERMYSLRSRCAEHTFRFALKQLAMRRPLRHGGAETSWPHMRAARHSRRALRSPVLCVARG